MKRITFQPKPHPIVENPKLLDQVLEEITVGSFGYDNTDGVITTSLEATDSDDLLQTNVATFRTESLLQDRYVAALDRVTARNRK